MDDELEVVAPAAEETETASFDERLEKFVTEQVSATTDSASTEEPVTEEAPAPAETEKVEEPAPVVPEKIVVTDEQLRDKKYWGGLDAAGWQRMERDYPVATAHVKAAQAAGTRIVNEAREAAAAMKPKEEPTSEATPKKVSTEMRAALLKAQSLDEDEAIEGAAEVARLTVREERERERTAQAEEAQVASEVLTNAYNLAVSELPALKTIPDKDLDAEVEGSPKMMRKINAATSHPDREQRELLIADVMVEAGRSIVAKRQAAVDADAQKKAADKKAADQARLRSNERNPSAHIVDTQSGKGPGGKKTIEKDGLTFVQNQLAAHAAKS